eukprot:scaffold128010_cov18-Tisochrysis_lutea.AAC.1
MLPTFTNQLLPTLGPSFCQDLHCHVRLWCCATAASALDREPLRVGSHAAAACCTLGLYLLGPTFTRICTDLPCAAVAVADAAASAPDQGSHRVDSRAAAVCCALHADHAGVGGR